MLHQCFDLAFYLSLQLIDNYVGGRGIITETMYNGNGRSNIYVPKATVMDSGNYTCSSSGLKTNSTVKVHVLVDGEFVHSSHDYFCMLKFININVFG